MVPEPLQPQRSLREGRPFAPLVRTAATINPSSTSSSALMVRSPSVNRCHLRVGAPASAPSTGFQVRYRAGITPEPQHGVDGRSVWGRGFSRPPFRSVHQAPHSLQRERGFRDIALRGPRQPEHHRCPLTAGRVLLPRRPERALPATADPSRPRKHTIRTPWHGPGRVICRDSRC